MIHLEEHPHAFIKNGIVENILVFASHDQALLNQCKEQFASDEVVCCCDYGIAYINGTWDGFIFKPKKLFESWVWNGTDWEAPIPMPLDENFYKWSEESNNWVVSFHSI